jgi:hypothetical protein
MHRGHASALNVKHGSLVCVIRSINLPREPLRERIRICEQNDKKPDCAGIWNELYTYSQARKPMFSRRVSLLLLLTVGAVIQTPPASAQDKAVAATICEVARDPAAFDNKWVRLRATLAGNFEVSAIRDPDHQDCGSLWFTYPGSGPSAMVSMSTMVPTQPRTAVQLRKDHQFQRFQKLGDAKMYPRQRESVCVDCKRYEVTAVMVGLVEFAGPGHGFGHMNGFPVQFVLQSIDQTSVKDLAATYNLANFSTTPTRFPTGYLMGTLIGPDGRPIADADLKIYPATDESASIDDDSATTDGKGHFKFAVPPGSYIIGFNTFWKPSSKAPFPPTYYPSAQQRSAAKIVVVADKEHIGNLILKVARPLVARTIPVKVIWPDGQPVTNANVWLSQVSEPTMVVGMTVSHTTADGEFNLIGFEGIDYILHADKYAGLAQVSCARNVLIREGDSIPVRIQLSLTRTDYNVCKDIDFEVPTNPPPQP